MNVEVVAVIRISGIRFLSNTAPDFWGKQWQTTPRTCPGCSVPEPYRSHDWALVPANPASKAEYY